MCHWTCIFGLESDFVNCNYSVILISLDCRSIKLFPSINGKM